MSRRLGCGQGLQDERVDLYGDGALQTPQDLLAAASLGGSFSSIGAGTWVVDEPDEGDGPQGVVGGPVAAGVQAVADGLARGGLDRAGAAQGGKGNFAA